MVDRLFADTFLAGVYDHWHPRSMRADCDFYLPRIMAAQAVLDIGCGTGTLLHEARDAGHAGRLCDVDPASGMIAHARRRGDIEWVLGDLISGGWTDAFDLIVMTGHAFQAIVDDDELYELMAAAARALRPGGCFAFETRNPTARAWENWTPDKAVTVQVPDGTDVRITTVVTASFDGRTVSFTHRFDGAHPALPQTSKSILRFLDSDAVRALVEGAGLTVDAQFGDFDARPVAPDRAEIITLAVKPNLTPTR